MLEEESSREGGFCESGDPQHSEPTYRQIVDKGPADKQTLHELGLAAIRAGNREAAVDYLQRAIAVDGSQAAYHDHLGIALAGMERFDQAIASFHRAIELDPRSSDAHSDLLT